MNVRKCIEETIPSTWREATTSPAKKRAIARPRKTTAPSHSPPLSTDWQPPLHHHPQATTPHPANLLHQHQLPTLLLPQTPHLSLLPLHPLPLQPHPHQPPTPGESIRSTTSKRKWLLLKRQLWMACARQPLRHKVAVGTLQGWIKTYFKEQTPPKGNNPGGGRKVKYGQSVDDKISVWVMEKRDLQIPVSHEMVDITLVLRVMTNVIARNIWQVVN